MHVIAAKAVAFREALQPAFRAYQQQVLANANALAAEVARQGMRLVSGGTDNHLLLVDLRPIGVSGRQAETLLDGVGIHINKNVVPFDPQPPLVTSGIRLGSPACTTRGMGVEEFTQFGRWIGAVLSRPDDGDLLNDVAVEVEELASRFPVPA